MRYSIKAGSPEKVNVDCLVVAIWNKGTLSDEAKQIDIAASKTISKILKSGDFIGKLGETQLIHNPAGISAKRVLLVGAGDKKKLSGKAVAKLMSSALKVIRASQASSVHFAFNNITISDRDGNWLAARVSQETEIANYRYDTTKSKKAKAYATQSVSLSSLSGARRKNLEVSLKRGKAIGSESRARTR